MVAENAKLLTDIKTYEEKHQMSSEQFYKLFCEGKMDDREDYMIWAGLWELTKANEKN